MTKAVFGQAALNKALGGSLPAGAICGYLTLASVLPFQFFAFPQIHTAGLGKRTGLQCVTQTSTGLRRNP
jgi:hypothetical protein